LKKAAKSYFMDSVTNVQKDGFYQIILTFVYKIQLLLQIINVMKNAHSAIKVFANNVTMVIH
jgi:hypothetical protein